MVAALVHEGRVLPVHRHPGRENYPDCWDLPGGHVEAGETLEAALRRECREELGIEIHRASPLKLGCSNPRLAKHAFLVTEWSGAPTNRAPEEHDDLGWFTAAELASLTMSDPAGHKDLGDILERARPPGCCLVTDTSSRQVGRD